jgi:hypothetical protein
MWLITTQGFLSVVQNLNSTGLNDALLVRGRGVPVTAGRSPWRATKSP